MKKVENIKYNFEFLEKVFAYLNDYDVLGIDINSLNSFSSKEKYAFERLRDVYSKIKLLKDYQEVSLEHFSCEEALDKANSFLVEIFPKKEKEILSLDNLIWFDNYSIYETGLVYRIDKDKILFDKILIPDIGSDYISSVIVHEKVHALAFNNIDLVSLYINKLELFPMFVQRMMIESTNNQLCNILDRIIRINDTKECFEHLEMANYLKNLKNKTELDKYVSNYFSLRSYDYLISELYSDLLFKYYLLDKEKMKKQLNQVFDDKLSILHFLNNYNVNLNNNELVSTIKEETDKCKRISIIP